MAGLTFGAFIKAIFVGAAAGAGAGVIAGVTIARIALLAVAAKLTARKPQLPDFASQKLTSVRSTREPRRVTYGRDLLSGPVFFINLGGTDNKTLYQSVALTGHEVDAIEEVWIDIQDNANQHPNTVVTDAQIDAVTLNVTSGPFAEVDASTPVMRIYRGLGDPAQGIDPILQGDFPVQWTNDHRMDGVATVTVAATIVEGREDAFPTGFSNIRALIRGKKIYDPRLDSTNGGTGTHRLGDETTWEWSRNNALVLADYMRAESVDYPLDGQIGWTVPDNRLDWALVRAAADVCDETLEDPSGTVTRYQFDGTIVASDQREQVIESIKDSFLCRMAYVNGLWKMWAGVAQAATVTLTADDLRDGPDNQPQSAHRERWNRVRGNFIDPDRFYQAVGYPEQRSSTFETEDTEVRYRDLDFSHTKREFECQRKAIIRLKQSRNQEVVIWPGNWRVFRIMAGITVLVTLPEQQFSSTKFLVTEWALAEDGNGIDLTLVKEDDTAWADPLVGEYTSRARGIIQFNDIGVPAPSGLTAIGVDGGIQLQWTNPSAELFDVIEIHASPDSAFSNSILVETVRATTYLHRFSVETTRFYWIRARTAQGLLSARFPDSDVSTISARSQIRERVQGIPAGVTGDLLFFHNMDIDGVQASEVRVRGTFIQDPTTDIKKSFNRGNALAEVRTPFNGAVTTDAAYLMWSDTLVATRFATLTIASIANHQIIAIEYDDAAGTWEAMDDANTREAFTPAATDIILARIVKTSTTGGIDSLLSFIDFQLASDAAPVDLFVEDFAGRDMKGRYLPVATEVDNPGVVTYTEDGDVGGVVLQSAGDLAGTVNSGRQWRELDRLFPFNPKLLYKFTFRARQPNANTTANNDFFAGFAGVAADGFTRINTAGVDTSGSSHYIAALSVELDNLLGVNEWGEFVGYLYGHDTLNDLPDSNTIGNRDPFIPSHAEPGIKHFRPQFILNLSGDATTQLDYYKIEAIDPASLNPIIPDAKFSLHNDLEEWWEDKSAAGGQGGSSIIDSAGPNVNQNAARFDTSLTSTGDTMRLASKHQFPSQETRVCLRITAKFSNNWANGRIFATGWNFQSDGTELGFIDGDEINPITESLTLNQWVTFDLCVSAGSDVTAWNRFGISVAPVGGALVGTVDVASIVATLIPETFNVNRDGLVPKPGSGAGTRFLREDGVWAVP